MTTGKPPHVQAGQVWMDAKGRQWTVLWVGRFSFQIYSAGDPDSDRHPLTEYPKHESYLLDNPRWTFVRGPGERLVELAESTEVESLIDALATEQGEAQEVVIRALGRLGEVEPLVDALGREQGEAREVIIRELGRLGDVRAVIPLLEVLREAVRSENRRTVQKAVQALEAIGSPAASALVRGLDDEVTTVRWLIAQLLGKLGGAEAVPALQRALDDPDEGVREAAAVSLERIEAREERS